MAKRQSTLPPAPGTPTQVAHPWRAVVRTVVAAAVAAALTWLARVTGIDLLPLSGAIIDSLTIAFWTVLTGLVQWLLTRPQLQPLLRAIGLGTGAEDEEPKHRAE